MISEIEKSNNLNRIGLYQSDRTRFYLWTDGEHRVYFSAASQGKAMSIHIAAEGENKLFLREAVKEFCESIFNAYDWCEVIIGAIKSKSVVNLANKCGFEYLATGLDEEGKELQVYAKYRV